MISRTNKIAKEIKSKLDSQGGIIPENLEKAKKVDLITLPESIDGTNCGNCKFIKNNFCFHPKILMEVNDKMCCALWDSKGVIRHWELK